jgi:hypothetical protein
VSRTPGQEGYIVEFIRVDQSVKATAIDPATLTEASVIGPVRASRRELGQLAVRKLQYMLKKQTGE